MGIARQTLAERIRAIEERASRYLVLKRDEAIRFANGKTTRDE